MKTTSSTTATARYARKSSKVVNEAKSCRDMAVPSEVVRHEAAGVARDGGSVLADADAGGLVAHDPRADHGEVALEARQPVVRLPDVALGAVLARRFLAAPGRLDGHVRAFARVDRLLHEVGREAARLEARGKQVGMVREHLPEDRQDRLVG